jgi:hypothetical protein
MNHILDDKLELMLKILKEEDTSYKYLVRSGTANPRQLREI